jgi:hypothetical protein
MNNDKHEYKNNNHEENKKIIQLSIISALSYVNIGKMSKLQQNILRGNNTKAKEILLYPRDKKETVSDYEYSQEIIEVLREYEFLDFYREDKFHHRQMIAMKNKKTGKVVFGVRGTEGARDIFTDAMLGIRRITDFSTGARVLRTGMACVSAIFPFTSMAVLTGAVALSTFSKKFTVQGYMNDSENFIKMVMEKHNIKKEDIIVTGHSLGAIMAQLISARVGVEGHGFNGFSVEKNLLTFEELKHLSTNHTNHSFDKDALSNFANKIVEAQEGKTKKYDSFRDENMLSAHSIVSFNKSLIRWMKTSELLNNGEKIEDITLIMKEHGKREFMEMFLYKTFKREEEEKEESLLFFKDKGKKYFKHFKDEEILEFYDRTLLNFEDNKERIMFLIEKTNKLNKRLAVSVRMEKIKDLSHYYLLKTRKELNNNKEIKKVKEYTESKESKESKLKINPTIVNDYPFEQYY